MSGSGWRFAGVWPWWVLAGLALAALAASALTYRAGYRRLSGGRMGGLLFLRFVWMAAIAAAAMEPVVESVQAVRDVPSIVFLVDSSASMAEEDEKGESRWKAAKDALEAVWPEVQAASEKFVPVLAGFDSEVRPVFSPGDLPGPEGVSSRLDEALRWTMERAGLPSLGVVVFTDGAADSYVKVMEEVERVKSMRLPVYPVMLGSAGEAPDVWIGGVELPGSVPVREETPLKVKVLHSMPAPGEFRVWLSITEDGVRRVDAGPVTLYGIGGMLEVPARYKPLTPGYHWLEFGLRPLPGERRVDNNYAVRVVKAEAGEVSVLTVSRGFSFDVGLVGRALKTLRGAVVEAYSAPAAQPRFQSREDLGSFYDVVVVEAAALPALRGPYLEALGEFVRGGGGMVFLAGPDWPEDADGDFAEVFGAPASARKERSLAGWRVVPGEAGGKAVELAPGPAGNRNAWAALGPLHYRFSADLSFLGGRSVLLRFADGAPFVVEGSLGKGRVVFVLGGPLFRWALGSAREASRFARFVRGLVSEVNPGRKRKDVFRLRPERLVYRRGEEIALAVQAPRAGTVRLVVEDYSGARARPVAVVPAALGEGANRVVLGKDVGPGGFRVRLVVPGEAEASAECGFVVEAAVSEADRSVPEFGLLDYIASETRGRSVRGKAGGEELVRRLLSQPPPAPRYIRRNVPAVPFYVYLTAFLFSAAAEWYFRRRWGLV